MNRTMYVDIKTSDLESLKIGDTISLRVKGVVKGLNAGTSPEGDYEGCPPDLRLEVQKVSIDAPNDYTDMAEED